MFVITLYLSIAGYK